MQVAIMAGGRGTRLAPLTDKIPKPMVQVNGKPFLEHEIMLLRENGISDFVLCVGYLSSVIQGYFGDGRKYDVRIKYSNDGNNPLGVIGALKKAEPLLEDNFFMTYGDTYLRTDYANAMKKFQQTGKLGMMFVFENRNRFGRSDVEVKDGFVINYDKKVQSANMNFINYGVTALKRQSLERVPRDREFGEQEFFGDLVKYRELLAHVVYERFYEIGTMASLQEFESFMKS